MAQDSKHSNYKVYTKNTSTYILFNNLLLCMQTHYKLSSFINQVHVTHTHIHTYI